MQNDVHGAGDERARLLQPGGEATPASPTQANDDDVPQVQGDCELHGIAAGVPDTEVPYYMELSLSNRKGSIPYLNDFLGKLLTLVTALIGGGFVVARGDVLPTWSMLIVVVLLFMALIAVLSGLMPRAWRHHPHDLAAVADAEMKTLTRKYKSIKVAVGFFIAAIAWAIIGLFAKQITG